MKRSSGRQELPPCDARRNRLSSGLNLERVWSADAGNQPDPEWEHSALQFMATTSGSI